MAASCAKKSLKHKLAQALATTESAKKVRISSSASPSLKNNDSGIGSSVPSKKKHERKKNPSKHVKISAKRRLETANEPDNCKPVDIAEMDVSQILALGEGTSTCQPLPVYNEAITDSEESDWEEVVENGKFKEPVIPENGVDITLDAPLISFKRKKREFDLQGEVRRQLKRRQKEIQELVHKVHLLCWIAHIKFVNVTLNSDVLLSECHKVLSSKNYYPPKHADLAYLERIVKTFRKHIDLNENVKEEKLVGGLESELCLQFQKKNAYSKNALVFMFIAFLRSLGIKARLIMSIVSAPLKPSFDKIESKEKKVNSIKVELDEKVGIDKHSKDVKKIQSEEVGKASLKNNLVKNLKAPKLPRKKAEPSVKASGSKAVPKTKKEPQTVVAKDTSDSDNEPLSKHFKEKKKPASKKLKVPVKPGKPTTAPKKESDNSDDDFSPVRKTIVRGKKLDRRVLSSDEENVATSKKQGQDVWVEVFLEAEEKWITVDIVKQKVHCVQFLYARATHPVVYVLACNNDSTIKDITKRYVPHWHSDTRKKRVAETWWNETLWPYKPPSSAQEKEEDEDIARQLEDMPLPSSITEYKSHPLYALKRHLLKFEGIYPPDAPTLGFVRGEPVYGRECVVTLRSRDIWFKEARVVRLKETPYKIVKSRPKYDKMTGDWKKDLPLELFGVWQTEDYIPPIAVDGKVPRNEYGNVDLFKPCMLPGGTVHLQVPALNRVARKLGIDCAPAVVGFEFHSGGCHPLHDGFVICEEFKDKLLDAWNKEIDESAKRAEEKREKRVYGNWRRLIRGLIIREKLKMKYAFGERSDDEEPAPSTSRKSTDSEPPAKKKRGKINKK